MPARKPWPAEYRDLIQSRRRWIRCDVRSYPINSRGIAFSQPVSSSPHNPTRIASDVSCRSEVGRGASDHSITRRAMSSALRFACLPLRWSREYNRSLRQVSAPIFRTWTSSLFASRTQISQSAPPPSMYSTARFSISRRVRWALRRSAALFA